MVISKQIGTPPAGFGRTHMAAPSQTIEIKINSIENSFLAAMYNRWISERQQEHRTLRPRLGSQQEANFGWPSEYHRRQATSAVRGEIQRQLSQPYRPTHLGLFSGARRAGGEFPSEAAYRYYDWTTIYPGVRGNQINAMFDSYHEAQRAGQGDLWRNPAGHGAPFRPPRPVRMPPSIWRIVWLYGDSCAYVVYGMKKPKSIKSFTELGPQRSHFACILALGLKPNQRSLWRTRAKPPRFFFAGGARTFG